MVDVDEKACGRCAHMEQLRSGIMRVCEVKRCLVNALDHPCNKYVDVWERNLFGEFDVYHATLKRQERQKQKFQI